MRISKKNESGEWEKVKEVKGEENIFEEMDKLMGDEEILSHNGENMENVIWIIPNRIAICTIEEVPSLDFMGPNKEKDMFIYKEWETKMNKICNIGEVKSPKRLKDITNDLIKYFEKEDKKDENN